MGPKEYQIVLDSPVYHAGQNVSGKLVVQLKKPRVMKGLYVKYFGKGTVQWSEGWGTTMVTHSNTETYLMVYQEVFGNGVDECELGAGKHVFDFSCQLPTELPCSFHGVFGKINYSVRAVIDRPWKSDYVAKQSMTIMSIFDLNYFPMASTPIEESSTKTFWGKPKPLTMNFNVPIRGFVPGQKIPINVILNNESDVHIKSVTATLKQKIVFHAAMKSSPMKLSILKTETPVERGFGCHEATLTVQIPALPPSYLQFCRIIDLRYQLKVKARVSGCRRSLKMATEVIIGNIPIMSYELPISNQRLICSPPFDPENYQPPPYEVVFPEYQDLALPSYEQITKPGNTDETNPGDEVGEFSPLYPVYKFGPAKA